MELDLAPSFAFDTAAAQATAAAAAGTSGGGRKRRTNYVKMRELEASIAEVQAVEAHLQRAIAEAEANVSAACAAHAVAGRPLRCAPWEPLPCWLCCHCEGRTAPAAPSSFVFSALTPPAPSRPPARRSMPPSRRRTASSGTRWPTSTPACTPAAPPCWPRRRLPRRWSRWRPPRLPPPRCWSAARSPRRLRRRRCRPA